MRRYMMFAALLVAVSTAAVASEFRPGEDWAIAYAPSGGNGVERGMRDAALALRSVIQEAFGVSVPVSTNAGDAARAFYLGRAFAEKAGLPCDGFVGWDNAIAERGGSFYFYGNDRTGARPQYATGCVVPSALAAVRFMKDYLGVLFVMPGAVGREVPRRESFSFPDGGVDRGSVRSEYQIGRNFDYAYNLANGIYGGGTLYSYGGHTYPVACPRKTYFKTHPEYFAMKADGTRVWGGSDGCQPYCISNPGFRRLLYDELLRRYDEGADIVQLAQNDGPVGCACAECRALYGTGDDWGEKTWLFHREIAERILKDRPGKLVHIISYGDTDEPPKSFRVFPPNVLIEVARYSDKDMRRWDGYVVPHGFTYYVYNWSWYPLLGFTPKRSVAGLVDQIRVFNRYGMKGIYRCGYGEMFGMEGPAYWVYNTLVGDPGADVAAALETYYRGAFGAAAPAMRRFYEDLEKPLSEVERLNSTKASDLVESTLRLAKGKDPVAALAHVYTPQRRVRMDAALAEAERTPGLSEKQRKRLCLVRTEWDYVRNVGAIAYDYVEYLKHPTFAACQEILGLLDERKRIIDMNFPEGKVRAVPGWHELRLFGSPPLSQFRVNGRLGARIEKPLLWDVEKMRRWRIVPGERMTPEERRAEIEKAGLKPLTGFRPVDASLPGATFKEYPDGTGFTFGQGTNQHVRVMKRMGAAEGVHPGKTYRITWLTRWEDVHADRSWRGYYFSADCKPLKYRASGIPTSLKIPENPLHSGDSRGWVRESGVMTVCDEPGFASDFIFRFWGGRDGIAEVRDVTIEEME